MLRLSQTTTAPGQSTGTSTAVTNRRNSSPSAEPSTCKRASGPAKLKAASTETLGPSWRGAEPWAPGAAAVEARHAAVNPALVHEDQVLRGRLGQPFAVLLAQGLHPLLVAFGGVQAFFFTLSF